MATVINYDLNLYCTILCSNYQISISNLRMGPAWHRSFLIGVHRH